MSLSPLTPVDGRVCPHWCLASYSQLGARLNLLELLFFEPVCPFRQPCQALMPPELLISAKRLARVSSYVGKVLTLRIIHGIWWQFAQGIVKWLCVVPVVCAEHCVIET